MSQKMNRRNFFANTALSSAGLVLGSAYSGCSRTGETPVTAFDIMSEMQKEFWASEIFGKDY